MKKHKFWGEDQHMCLHLDNLEHKILLNFFRNNFKGIINHKFLLMDLNKKDQDKEKHILEK